MDGNVFTKETKHNLRKLLDEVIVLKGFRELLSDIGLFGVVEAVDYFGDKVIPDEYDAPLNSIAEKAIAGDYDAALTETGTLLNKIIDVPVLDETSEEFVFQQGLRFLLSIIKQWLQKRKQV